MSVTYSIVCDECKVACWAGQSGYIYSYKYIDDFLKEHIGHKLRYLCDETMANDEEFNDYVDCLESGEVLDSDVETAKAILRKANIISLEKEQK